MRNLAGVPSIIYGMVGLAIFVRALAPFSSGLIFHYNFDVPTTESVIERIAPAFDGRISATRDIISSDSDLVDVPTIQRIVDTFLFYGTPSLTMQGNSDVPAMANSLAEALDIVVDTVPVRADEPHDFEVRGNTYRIGRRGWVRRSMTKSTTRCWRVWCGSTASRPTGARWSAQD